MQALCGAPIILYLCFTCSSQALLREPSDRSRLGKSMNLSSSLMSLQERQVSQPLLP